MWGGTPVNLQVRDTVLEPYVNDDDTITLTEKSTELFKSTKSTGFSLLTSPNSPDASHLSSKYDTNSTKNDDVVLPVGAGAGDNTSDAGIRASIRASRHALFAVLLGSTIVIYISASVSDLNEIYEVLNAGRPGRSRHLRNLQSRSTSDVHAQVGAAMQTHASAHGLHGFGEECGKNFYVMWAVICSTVSAFVSLYLLLAGLVNGGANPIPLLGMSMKWPSGFLAIWWTFGTGTFTFDKPFAHVGNGFFASRCLFCLFLAASHIPIVAQKFNDARTAVQAQCLDVLCQHQPRCVVCFLQQSLRRLGAWAVACSAVSFLSAGPAF